MAMMKIVLLLLALVASTTAQIRAPVKINICYPVGNNTHSTATVLPTEVSKYPGYVKGACSKICPALCADFASRKVNTAGQCICIGATLKCGVNARPSSDQKSCVCLVGYKGDAVKGCADLNECNSTKAACPVNHACTNTVGSFQCQACGTNSVLVNNQCQCKPGFTGDAVKGCTDVNECASATSVCPVRHGCSNTVGSFQCQPCGANSWVVKNECKCKPGFTGDAIKGCTDINECNAAKSPCAANHGCINTVGSFQCQACGPNALVVKNQCQCKIGFEGDAIAGCTDIHECYSSYGKPSPCPDNLGCINTEGSFTCQACVANAILHNDHECRCEGTFFEGDGYKQCTAIDGCKNRGGHEKCALYNQLCVNEDDNPRDWNCVTLCADNNECDANELCVDTSCGQKCEEKCSYDAIYSKETDSCSCKVDHNGDPREDCRMCGDNTEVSDGNCQCLTGFEGDPHTGCFDIDECAPGKPWWICDAHMCVNTVGSFQCVTCGANAWLRWPEMQCHCDDGYIGDPVAGCVFDICQTEEPYEECANVGKVCVNGAELGAYTCADMCPVGQFFNADHERCEVCVNGEVINGECQCSEGFRWYEDGGCIRCGDNAFYNDGECMCRNNYDGDANVACYPVRL